MKALAAIVCLAAGPMLGAEPELKTLLKGVESRYNHAKTLQVAFAESYTMPGRPRQNEAGTLILRKPGRMRWDYSTPPGKLFVSDGKQVYLYTPDLNRVERMPLKESEDMRAPLAFLLGRLEFSKEFRDLAVRPEGANFLVTATAKNDKLPYDKIEMLITPQYEIRHLVVNGLDRSVLSFDFQNEQLNGPVDDARFQFHMPAGATLVSGEQSQ
jgi:outer membrane lipoprotein carrier protein